MSFLRWFGIREMKAERAERREAKARRKLRPQRGVAQSEPQSLWEMIAVLTWGEVLIFGLLLALAVGGILFPFTTGPAIAEARETISRIDAGQAQIEVLLEQSRQQRLGGWYQPPAQP